MKKRLSIAWIVVSMIVFIASELLIGSAVGKYISGIYLSLPTSFLLMGLLNLVSYFIGGIVIGFIAPRRRVLEPALGAAACVLLTFVITLFAPQTFYQFDSSKLIAGGLIAFFIALVGSSIGESFKIGRRAELKSPAFIAAGNASNVYDSYAPGRKYQYSQKSRG